MSDLNYMSCCGLRELYLGHNKRSPSNALKEAFKHADHPLSAGAYIFTQASRDKKAVGYGYRLANYIINNDLGEVTVMPLFRNPNSGNVIHTFLWILNKQALDKWIDANVEEDDYTWGWSY